jgi:O-antigen/teichoic acid export membrane protein
MQKQRTFSKNFLILFSGNGVGQILPLLFAPIIGRLFLEEEMGTLANFIGLAGMISIIAGGRYEMAIVLPSDKSRAMNLFALATRIAVVVTILSGLFYFFREPIGRFYKDDSIADLMLLLIVAIPLYGFTNFFTQWLNRESKYKSLTYSGIARSAFISVFTILFGYASMGAMGLALGTLVGLLVALVLMIISANASLDFSLVSRKGMTDVAKEYKDFPMINSAHAFVDLLFGQFILYAIITREFGAIELGLFYMMARYLLASMKAIGGSVGQLYYKEASDSYSSGSDVSVVFRKSVKLVLYFAVPVLLVILFFGPEIFGWYLGDRYEKSGVLAQIMIIPYFINFVVSPVSATPIIYRKQGLAFVFSLLSYVFGILAIVFGNYYKLDFYETIKIYAAVQTVYYLWLFIWYYSLTRSKK